MDEHELEVHLKQTPRHKSPTAEKTKTPSEWPDLTKRQTLLVVGVVVLASFLTALITSIVVVAIANRGGSPEQLPPENIRVIQTTQSTSGTNQGTTQTVPTTTQTIPATYPPNPDTTQSTLQTSSTGARFFTTNKPDFSRVLPTKKFDGNNSTYLFVTNGMLSWMDARSFCESVDMRLASVEARNELEYMFKYIKELELTNEKSRFWLSGTQIGRPGTYFWVSTGKAIENVEWGWIPGGAKGQGCIELQTSNKAVWADRDCKDQLFFICEKTP